MLKSEAVALDTSARRDDLLGKAQPGLNKLREQFGADAVVELSETTVVIAYPVQQYPTKVSSFDFEKTPEVSGQLKGIKGQYLIFDSGVINFRKFGGYELRVSI